MYRTSAYEPGEGEEIELVKASDYDALAARLAEAERLLRELPVACACECLADVKAHVDAFLGVTTVSATRESAV